MLSLAPFLSWHNLSLCFWVILQQRFSHWLWSQPKCLHRNLWSEPLTKGARNYKHTITVRCWTQSMWADRQAVMNKSFSFKATHLRSYDPPGCPCTSRGLISRRRKATLCFCAVNDSVYLYMERHLVLPMNLADSGTFDRQLNRVVLLETCLTADHITCVSHRELLKMRKVRTIFYKHTVEIEAASIQFMKPTLKSVQKLIVFPEITYMLKFLL